MIIKREMTFELTQMAAQFPIVAIMGPRQSGKTTLAQETFKSYAYVTMEDLDKREAALGDPRGFFAAYAHHPGLIIDEIQEAPTLLSYMQGIVDQQYRPGFFIITGSQNFLLHEKITQTLAGRIALLTLLPLSIHEIQQANLPIESLEHQIIKGFYPRLYVQPINPEVWCTNYINTYVQKDVRQIVNITDMVTFQRFLKLCAARIGNVLNYASLARDADISPNTAKAWISILEASYIIKLLYPYYKNFNKRVIKSPKLYFYDTSLICSLLGIKSADELQFHPFKGALFETLVISECFKYNYNRNNEPHLYFWRDIQGHEIDIIVEKSLSSIVPIEIKAGKTVTKEFFRGLDSWKKISNFHGPHSYIVYSGPDSLQQKETMLYDWKDITKLLTHVYDG